MTENANVYRCTLIPVEKEAMTDNSELEAAIEKLISVIRDEFDTYDIKNDQLPMFTDVRTAFAAYRDRFHALEADNERTNRDRSALCVDFALLTEENARLRETLRQIHNNAPKQEPIQPHPQNYPQAHSFWVAGQLAAAVLADSEGE